MLKITSFNCWFVTAEVGVMLSAVSLARNGGLKRFRSYFDEDSVTWFLQAKVFSFFPVFLDLFERIQSVYWDLKILDYGFVNSILRSGYVPPKDMWFAGGSINYYYFGHYISAFLTRLSGIATEISYNLMMATLLL